MIKCIVNTKLVGVFLSAILLLNVMIWGFAVPNDRGGVHAAQRSETVCKYEAENAQSDGQKVLSGFGNLSFSGEAYLLEPAKSLTFTLDIADSGFYRIQIRLLGYFEGQFRFDGSNGIVMYVTVPIDSADMYTISDSMYIERGEHTLSFVCSDTKSYCVADYLTVERLSECDGSLLDGSRFALSNAAASPKARRLYDFIKSNYGNNIIAGQNTVSGYTDPDFMRIKEKTGKLPLMIGLDLMEYSGGYIDFYDGYQINTDRTIGYAQEYAALGGIVAFQWHWVAPSVFLNRGVTPDYSGCKSDNVNKERVRAALKAKNGSDYEKILNDMDLLAIKLKRLADADVPVLFRPLHEGSGDWFWWGLGDKEDYIALWRTLYIKFTDEYKLNNLIWVWNGQNKGWYPGDEYVDVVGEDVYMPAKDYSADSLKFAQGTGHSDGAKPVAMTECGVLPDIDAAIASKSMWSWFLNWTWVHTIPHSGDQQYAEDANGNEIAGSDGSKYPVQTELDKWMEVYNHEHVLTLDDSPFHVHVFNENAGVCDVCGAAVGMGDKPSGTPPDETTGDPPVIAPEKSNGGWIAAVAVLSVLLAAAVAAIVVLRTVPIKKSGRR